MNRSSNVRRIFRRDFIHLGQEGGVWPQSLGEIEVRGEQVSRARRRFKKPQMSTWNDIRSVWGRAGTVLIVLKLKEGKGMQ
jgi:hypothetical protein